MAKYDIDINELKEGMVTFASIIDPRTGSVLVTAGTMLTSKYIEILKKHKVESVKIRLNDIEKETYNLNNNVIPTVSKTIVDKSEKVVKKIYDRASLSDENVESVLSSARDMANSVLNDSKFSYRLTDYKTNKENINHIVRVAAYAAAVARRYNEDYENRMDREKYQISLKNIAVAVLLKDVGEACKNKDVLNGIKEYVDFGDRFQGLDKTKSLELKYYYDEKYIPYYSYNLIHKSSNIPNESKAMVLYSREDENGDGPLRTRLSMDDNLKSKHIIAAKIINLCDEFDTFLMENIKEGVTLENAYSMLMKLVIDGKIDERLFTCFIETIPLYPEGTKVMLHGLYNGYAIVERNFDNKANYARPILRTIPGNHHIDLRFETTTTIKQVVGDEVKLASEYFNKVVNSDSNDLKDMLEEKKKIEELENTKQAG